MKRRRAPWYALTAAALLWAATPAGAQRVLGVGDDALVLPRGVFRLRVLSQWATFNQRYGCDTPGRECGALEPLAVDFNLDTVGLTQFPNLAPVQAGFRSLTGIPDLNVSLGRTVVNADVSVIATPIVLDFGITDRFSMAINLPYVRTRNNIFFDVNPAGREGNVGFNPARAVEAFRLRNDSIVTQLNGAAALVEASLGGSTFCAANPADSRCALINSVRAFAGGIAQLYGTVEGAGSPFVPVAGTAAQLAIEARIAAFKSLLGAAGAGIVTTGPAASFNRLGISDAQRILTDAAFGLSAAPLQTIEHSHIGDIEIGAKFKLLDSFGDDQNARFSPSGFNYRTAVTGLLRLGTGQNELPTNFVDVGTGNGQNDFEFRSATDLLFGKYFWTSLIGRYVYQQKDNQFQRITDRPERALAPLYREQKVERKLGNFIELEAYPRVVFNDYFAVSGHYYYRNKQEDSYTGQFTIPGSVTGFGDLQLNANTLNLETEQTEHRLGGGVSFSTLAAFNRGRAPLPLEITYFHYQTTKGNGGNVPKVFVDQLQLRVYPRIFGGPPQQAPAPQ